MTSAEITLLFAAGLIGGVMNTVAGGGTFVTFPTLVFVGVPAIAANASATFAAMPGYLAGALGFRRELRALPRPLVARLTLWTLLGGAIGGGLLLVSSEGAFRLLVPVLLLLSTCVFLWSEQVRAFAARHASSVAAFGAGTLLPVAIYGGYFNGGLGIILLALFALWGMTDLHQMNGLKTWLSFALSIITVVVLAAGGQIVWAPGLVMMGGNVTGGFLGAPIARRLPRAVLRGLIALIGFVMTAVFLVRLL